MIDLPVNPYIFLSIYLSTGYETTASFLKEKTENFSVRRRTDPSRGKLMPANTVGQMKLAGNLFLSSCLKVLIN